MTRPFTRPGDWNHVPKSVRCAPHNIQPEPLPGMFAWLRDRMKGPTR